MWKLLNPVEQLSKGDTVRYKLTSSNIVLAKNKIYQVVKVDSHYFVVSLKSEKKNNDEQDCKIITYMDIGYHVDLEKWIE